MLSSLEGDQGIPSQGLDLLPVNSAHRTNLLLTLSYGLGRQGRQYESYQVLKQAQLMAVAHGIDSMLIFSYMEECHIALDLNAIEHAGLLYGAYLELAETTGYSSNSPTRRILRPKVELEKRLEHGQYLELLARGAKMPKTELIQMRIPVPMSDVSINQL